MTGREMAARMPTTCTTDIWDVNPIASRHGPSFRKEEHAVYFPTNDKDDEILTDLDEVRPTHVEVQHMIESTLQMFKETNMKSCLGVMVETKAVSSTLQI